MAEAMSCIESSTFVLKNRLFSSYCSTLCLCSLWAKCRKSSIRHLIVSYNNVYMLLYNLPMRCSASFMLPSAVVDSIVLRVLEMYCLAY